MAAARRHKLPDIPRDLPHRRPLVIVAVTNQAPSVARPATSAADGLPPGSRSPPSRRINFAQASDLPADGSPSFPTAQKLSVEKSARATVDRDLIVAVGRLERYKGHQRLIAALPYLRAQRSNARLRIVGDGPYREDLLRQAVSLGVADHVEIGALAAEDREAMAHLLSRAGVVALLSDYEAHPVSCDGGTRPGAPCRGRRHQRTSGDRKPWLGSAVAADASATEVATALLAGLDERSDRTVNLPTWDEAVTRLATLYRSAASSKA